MTVSNLLLQLKFTIAYFPKCALPNDDFIFTGRILSGNGRKHLSNQLSFVLPTKMPVPQAHELISPCASNEEQPEKTVLCLHCRNNHRCLQSPQLCAVPAPPPLLTHVSPVVGPLNLTLLLKDIAVTFRKSSN